MGEICIIVSKSTKGDEGMEKQLRFRKGDLLAAALVLLAAILLFLCFLPRGEAAYAEVYLHGELIQRLPLNRDSEITVCDGYTNTVTVSGGKIAVTASDCPGADCVGCGWSSTPGRSIVCLPNGLEIRIVSGQSDVDFVVG